jgi:hypothetical protein
MSQLIMMVEEVPQAFQREKFRYIKEISPDDLLHAIICTVEGL